jgi:hypothetical protein
MARDELAKYQATEDLATCKDVGAVKALVQRLKDLEASGYEAE